MNSTSSAPILRRKSKIGGIVASPTPTVGMAEDSTSVMRHPLPRSTCDSSAAADQPAVPPPTMQIEPIACA